MNPTRGQGLVARMMLWVVMGLFMCGVAVTGAEAQGVQYQLPQMPTFDTFSPTFTQPAFQMPSYSNPVPNYTGQLDYFAQPQRPQVNVNDYLTTFQVPTYRQQEWQRSDKAAQRNSITSTACHKYSRECLNRLLSLD